MANDGSSDDDDDDDDVGKTMREMIPDCEPERSASDDVVVSELEVMVVSAAAAVAVTQRTGSPSATSCSERMYSSRRGE